MVQTSHVIARFVSWFLCAFVLHVHVRSPLGIYCFTVGVSACAFARGRSRLEWSHARWFYSCFIVPDRSCLGALCTLCVSCDVRVFMCIYVCRKG